MSLQPTTTASPGIMAAGSTGTSKLNDFKLEFKAACQNLRFSPLKVMKDQPFGAGGARTLSDQIRSDLPQVASR